MLDLETLLSDPRYDLTLVAGDRECGAREVRGIHSSDYEHPSPWLDEGWILLTNGLRLKGRPQLQRGLVTELVDVGVAALGFGIGLPFKSPPAALVAEANRRRLPVFTVPLTTSFSEMMRRVYTELAVDEARVFQRLAAMQQYLIGAFDEHQPDGTIADRLASLIDARVVVVDAGSTVVQAGRLDAAAAWRELAAQPTVRKIVRFGLGELDCVAVPIGDSQSDSRRWLIAGARSLGPLVTPALQLAAPLFAAVSRIEEAVRRQELLIAEKLLADLLAASDASVAEGLVARAHDFGIDLSEPVRVVVARPRAGHRALLHDEETPTGARERIDDALRRSGCPHLLGSVGEDVAMLVQAGEPTWCELWSELRSALGARVLLAAGRPTSDACNIRMSLRDALLGVGQLANDRASDGTALDWEQLDLAFALLAEAEPARADAHARQVLEPLAAHPSLRLTLEAYFASELDVGRTAKRLHLHPNSLRYRLSRIEALLGRSLRAPETLADLHLALMAARAGLGESPKPPPPDFAAN